MSSKYKEILEERKSMKGSRKVYEHRQTSLLNNNPELARIHKELKTLKAQWDALCEKAETEPTLVEKFPLAIPFVRLIGKEVILSAVSGNVSGLLEDVIGEGYQTKFEIDGKLYSLFGPEKDNIYDVMDRSTQDSIYTNDHIGASQIEQIAYSLGMSEAKHYYHDQKEALESKEIELVDAIFRNGEGK